MQGGGTTQATQVQKADPWAPAQPYLTDIMSQAQGLQQQQSGTPYYQGQTVATPSAATQQGLDLTAQRAQNGSPVMGAADNSITNILNDGTPQPGNSTLNTFANPNNINPYLTAQYDAASKPVIDSINSQFSSAGRTGSTANQNALTSQLGNLSANIFSQGYDNAANRSITSANDLNANAATRTGQQLQAGQLAPGLANNDYTDLQNLLSVGGAQDQQSQAQLNDLLQRWQYTQQQPWSILNQYGGAVSGLGGLMPASSSGSSTQTQPGQSMIPSLLGAGLTAATMFSDRRLKTDIKRIGTADNGLPLYTFRYKGGDQLQVGLMADDVEKTKPDAVVHDPSGFMKVDYQRALAA